MDGLPIYKKLKYLILLVFLLLIANLDLIAQLSDTHYLPPLYAREYVEDHYMFITTPSLADVNVTVLDGNDNVVETVIVNNSQAIRIYLGNGYQAKGVIRNTQLNEAIRGEGLIVEASAPVYVQIRHIHELHALTLTSKGDKGIGNRFRIGTAYSTVSTTDRSDFISLMALEDNTTITFGDLTQGINFSGQNIGNGFTITLNRRESYVVAAHPNFLNNLFLNGTLVTSDKPIVTNVGSWVNGAGGFFQTRRDISAEQIFPADIIGDEYVLMGVDGDPDIERAIVIADSDNTLVYYDDGNLFALLDAGDYFIVPKSAYSNNDNLYIYASNPIYVYQTTGKEDYNGDLNILTPLDCWGTKNAILPPAEDFFFREDSRINILAKITTQININGTPVTNPNIIIGKDDWVSYSVEMPTINLITVTADDFIQVGTTYRSDARGAATYYSEYIQYDTMLQVELCGGDDNSYTVGNSTYFETGNYMDVLQSVEGCDSIVYLDLSIGMPDNTILDEMICEGETFEVGTQSYDEAGSYMDVLTNINGCDSIVELKLNLIPTFSDTTYQMLCEGESYMNAVYESDTTLTTSYSSINGCDSNEVVILEILETYNLQQEVIICEGESYEIGDNIYTEEDIYEDVLMTSDGCDSTILTVLIVEKSTINESNIVLCEGESYQGIVYQNDTTLVQNLSSIHGCDSTVISNLQFDSVKETALEVLLCPGQSYNGFTVFNDTTIIEMELTAEGCDSIITSEIQMELFTSLDTVLLDPGDVYNGIAYEEDDLILELYQSIEGCDSLAQTQIIINNIITGSQLVRLCEGESFNDIFYLSDTSFVETYVATSGVDSIITFNIEVYSTYLDTVGATICIGDVYFAGGAYQNESGFYTDNYAAAQGCDSVVVTALSVYSSITDPVTVFLCDGASYNGQTFNTDTLISETFSSVGGCDSTVISNIILSESIMTTDTIFISEGDSYNGVIYFQDSFLSQNLQSQNGCDSLAEVTIIVIPTISTIDTIQLCAGDSYEDTPYYNDDIIEETFTASTGGDSIHSTLIFVDESPFTNFGFTICFGDSLFTANNFQTNSGLYTTVWEAANGCDSTVLVNLFVAEEVATEVDTSICEGGFYYDLQIVSDTSLVDTLASVNSCDSILYTSIFMNPTPVLLDTVLVNEGDIYEGVLIPSDTLLMFNFTTSEGCDSTVNVQVVILPQIQLFDTLSICEGELFEDIIIENDTTIIQTYLSSTGVDSTLFITLEVMPTLFDSTSTNICFGDSILLAEAFQTEPGFYQDIIAPQSADGCPSVIVTELSLIDNTITTTEASVCEGDSILFNNQYYSEEGVYVGLFSSFQGCDSLVVLDLSFADVPSINFEGIAPYCEGEFVELNVGNYDAYNWSTGSSDPILQIDEAGTYAVTVTNSEGCTQADAIEIPAPITLSSNVDVLQPTCNNSNGTITINNVVGGDATYLFSLNNQVFSPANTFNNLQPDNYTISIQDANGCMLEETIQILESIPATLNLEAPSIIDFGDSIQIEVTTDISSIDSILWEPDLYLSCNNCLEPIATPAAAINYVLTIIDEDRCTIQETVTLRVDKNTDVFVPSAFSPNNDGINDVFTIYAGQEVENINQMQIFDRWGNLLFQKENIAPNSTESEWKGDFRGKDMMPAVYVYVLELRLIDGSTTILKGDFSLIK